jgi:hypothetical protein
MSNSSYKKVTVINVQGTDTECNGLTTTDSWLVS